MRACLLSLTPVLSVIISCYIPADTGSTPDCYGLTPVDMTDGQREEQIDRRVDGLIDGRMRRRDTINHRGRALLITAAADKMQLLPFPPLFLY